MLTSNEEISKIEKTYLKKHWQVFLVPDGQASSFPINLSVFRKHACQMPRGMLMPSPRGRDQIANAQPPGLTTWANAPWLPGGMGTAGIDWCISHGYPLCFFCKAVWLPVSRGKGTMSVFVIVEKTRTTKLKLQYKVTAKLPFRCVQFVPEVGWFGQPKYIAPSKESFYVVPLSA